MLPLPGVKLVEGSAKKRRREIKERGLVRRGVPLSCRAPVLALRLNWLGEMR